MTVEHRFVVLCDEERQAPYESELSGGPHHVELLGDVAEVLKSCIREPPLAVIGDMVSFRKMNVDVSVALTNLELHWLILRFRKKPCDGLTVIAIHPINIYRMSFV